MSRPALFDDGAWIEASRPLRQQTPVWPGDRPFELRQRREGGLVTSSYSTTCHVGTHMDAPLHLDAELGGIETVPTARCIGPAEVVAVAVRGRAAVPGDLPAGWTPRFPRVLLRTDSYPMDAAIDDRFAGISVALVNWLADRGVQLIGIDTPSVDHFADDGFSAHRALVERGLTWIENLWLADAPSGVYLLVALPPLLVGADGAPVRAVLRRIDDDGAAEEGHSPTA